MVADDVYYKVKHQVPPIFVEDTTEKFCATLTLRSIKPVYSDPYEINQDHEHSWQRTHKHVKFDHDFQVHLQRKITREKSGQSIATHVKGRGGASNVSLRPHTGSVPKPEAQPKAKYVSKQEATKAAPVTQAIEPPGTKEDPMSVASTETTTSVEYHPIEPAVETKEASEPQTAMESKPVEEPKLDAVTLPVTTPLPEQDMDEGHAEAETLLQPVVAQPSETLKNETDSVHHEQGNEDMDQSGDEMDMRELPLTADARSAMTPFSFGKRILDSVSSMFTRRPVPVETEEDQQDTDEDREEDAEAQDKESDEAQGVEPEDTHLKASEPVQNLEHEAVHPEGEPEPMEVPKVDRETARAPEGEPSPIVEEPLPVPMQWDLTPPPTSPPYTECDDELTDTSEEDTHQPNPL